MKGTLQQLKQALTPLGNHRGLDNQLRYNCPHCEKKLGNPIDKYNLEVNYKRGIWHCWSCNQSGPLYTVIKKYGYKEFLKLFKGLKIETPDVEKEDILSLPKHVMSIFQYPKAYDYLLKERNISKEKIVERGIKFCYGEQYKNCILFPTYNLKGILTGFISHNLITKEYRQRRGKDFVCHYESFIDRHALIILTEGIYDALIVPNAIPLAGLTLNEELLNFLSNTNVLLIVDTGVGTKTKKDLVKPLSMVCNSVTNHRLNLKYEDLNDYFTKDNISLRQELKTYYNTSNTVLC